MIQGAFPLATPHQSLEQLAESFLDLWHHYDPVEARRFDWGGPAPVLVAFDKETVRQHGAAFRSIEAAVLELELDALDHEIDRTILLAAIRPQIRRLDRDHPERHNPVFWTDRLVGVLSDRTGDAATLGALPAWVDQLRATLTNPPIGYLQVALDDIGAARSILARPDWWLSDKEALSQAAAGLDRLEQFLRHETTPNPALDGGATDEESVSWYLHHAALVEVGSGQAARRLRQRSDAIRTQLEGEAKIEVVGFDQRGVVEAYRQGLQQQGSQIRRRIASPSWLAGFGLFGQVGLAETSPDRRIGLTAGLLRTHLAQLDLEIQLGETAIAAALQDRAAWAVEIVRHPLEATVAALHAIEWEHVRGKWAGDLASFQLAVVEHGIMHPALASWRLGLG